MPSTLRTPKGRVSFPSVFEKRTTLSGSERFECQLLIPPDDELSKERLGGKPSQFDLWTTLHAALVNAAKEAWPKAKLKTDVQFPVQTIGPDDKYGRPAGYRCLKMWNAKIKPRVVDGRKNDITEDSGTFYAGCWAHVATSIWTSDNVNKTVGLNLGAIQKCGDDDSFVAGVVDVEEFFDDEEDVDNYVPSETSEAPADGDNPF